MDDDLYSAGFLYASRFCFSGDWPNKTKKIRLMFYSKIYFNPYTIASDGQVKCEPPSKIRF